MSFGRVRVLTHRACGSRRRCRHCCRNRGARCRRRAGRDENGRRSTVSFGAARRRADGSHPAFDRSRHALHQHRPRVHLWRIHRRQSQRRARARRSRQRRSTDSRRRTSLEQLQERRVRNAARIAAHRRRWHSAGQRPGPMRLGQLTQFQPPRHVFVRHGVSARTQPLAIRSPRVRRVRENSGLPL